MEDKQALQTEQVWGPVLQVNLAPKNLWLKQRAHTATGARLFLSEGTLHSCTCKSLDNTRITNLDLLPGLWQIPTSFFTLLLNCPHGRIRFLFWQRETEAIQARGSDLEFATCLRGSPGERPRAVAEVTEVSLVGSASQLHAGPHLSTTIRRRLLARSSVLSR